MDDMTNVLNRGLFTEFKFTKLVFRFIVVFGIICSGWFNGGLNLILGNVWAAVVYVGFILFVKMIEDENVLTVAYDVV